LAFGLSRLSHPETLQDTPIGVLRDVARPSYERLMHEQLDEIIEQQGKGDLHKLLLGKDTWQVN
jgi:2-oxoglutarate ferredoxin oxidoreductase subunit beta